MKFLVTNELRQNPLLKLLIGFFVGILILFAGLDLLLCHYQIGLTPDTARTTLLGEEEAFIEPLLFDVLLERIHISLFVSILMLVLLVIVFMRVSGNDSKKMIHTAFLSAILAPVSLLLGYFLGGLFIPLWIALFVLWHLSALYFAAAILRRLLR